MPISSKVSMRRTQESTIQREALGQIEHTNINFYSTFLTEAVDSDQTISFLGAARYRHHPHIREDKIVRLAIRQLIPLL